MEENIIYTQTDGKLNQFFAKIYGLVGMGIGLSAFVSFLMLYVFTDNMLAILTNYSWVYYAAVFLEFILVVSASATARKNTPAALPIFLIYSALNGFTLSFIMVAYTKSTVFQAFVSSAIVFFAMAFIGSRVKKDLSGMRKALFAGLIGIIVASLINIFIGNSGLDYLISIISVLIFSGLIAYDNQMIKRVYEGTGGRPGDGWAISMALSLYLDFINIFISILRIFGRND
ncbi:hypothetical protein HMPREF9318_01166 [Streptococcus urinalis FB127-CNA-2]|uniref:Membrane protein n=1 Tax=Streptococcus urinalis 2285-97 TaxID=764291 RepID=G5KI40_9STRE|nr:Bax inhibitor-1/YccA family protein [Streptococcus urinalis]EHJ57704.1 putative membrane protein [Streptococcus urinalis 2285-97]EKS20528.1 hypothetical protein HMPREF9318_01166 [Streptococcus urinalis FB127-CNA-2]VEF31221.1 membrane protein [Streptococcus urinalis]